MKKILAIVLALTMLLGCTGLAESTVSVYTQKLLPCRSLPSLLLGFLALRNNDPGPLGKHPDRLRKCHILIFHIYEISEPLSRECTLIKIKSNTVNKVLTALTVLIQSKRYAQRREPQEVRLQGSPLRNEARDR